VNKSVEEYRAVVGDREVDEIEEISKHLSGIKIKHVNSTKFGGGVAEILKSFVPLCNSLNIKTDWYVFEGSDEFFNISKQFHNALQGHALLLTESMKETYLKYNKLNAESLDLDADVVQIHDPQPAALIDHYKPKKGEWIWRCHIDLTNANPVFWKFLSTFVRKYDLLVFSLDKYVRNDVKDLRISVRPPTIDPLSDKNKPIPETMIFNVLDRFGVDPEKPIITQVARFDPWKDPLGVIDVYKNVKKRIPNVQLLLIGSMADDDPEGVEWYNKTLKAASDEENIKILTNLDGVSDIEVNAFQRASNVVIQKSIREGFGLTVTEALWKGVPVVSTRAGGIPLQVINGMTGYLVDSAEEMEQYVIYLLKHQFVGRILGIHGIEHVKRNFLITRLIKDYLRRLYIETVKPIVRI
jgi:trehalose synthase